MSESSRGRMSGNRSIGHDARGGHLARAREALDRPTGPATPHGTLYSRAAVDELLAAIVADETDAERVARYGREQREAELANAALAAPAADGLDVERLRQALAWILETDPYHSAAHTENEFLEALAQGRVALSAVERNMHPDSWERDLEEPIGLEPSREPGEER